MVYAVWEWPPGKGTRRCTKDINIGSVAGNVWTGSTQNRSGMYPSQEECDETRNLFTAFAVAPNRLRKNQPDKLIHLLDSMFWG
jgi:hypothetical protein